eukprot:196332-Hanusia_phi.AAC.4
MIWRSSSPSATSASARAASDRASSPGPAVGDRVSSTESVSEQATGSERALVLPEGEGGEKATVLGVFSEHRDEASGFRLDEASVREERREEDLGEGALQDPVLHASLSHAHVHGHRQPRTQQLL